MPQDSAHRVHLRVTGRAVAARAMNLLEDRHRGAKAQSRTAVFFGNQDGKKALLRQPFDEGGRIGAFAVERAPVFAGKVATEPGDRVADFAMGEPELLRFWSLPVPPCRVRGGSSGVRLPDPYAVRPMCRQKQNGAIGYAPFRHKLVSPMDLKRLRYFVCVSELGSFTLAARHLGVAQPALSRHIRQLEADCGSSLLRRNGRGAELTEVGRTMLEHGRSLLEQAAGSRQSLKAAKGAPVGAVNLGMPPSVCMILSSPCFTGCGANFPACGCISARASAAT